MESYILAGNNRIRKYTISLKPTIMTCNSCLCMCVLLRIFNSIALISTIIVRAGVIAFKLHYMIIVVRIGY